MTSRSSFFKLVWQEFYKRIWCPICIFIAAFLVLEVHLLMQIDAMESYPSSYDYDAVQFLTNYFFGMNNNWGVIIFTVLSAIVCGISGFCYLHSNVQLDTYHSLPVKRKTIFAARYTAGIFFYLPMLFAHILICLLMALLQGILTSQAVFNAFCFLGVQLVIFLLVYSLSVFCVMLTGNLIMSILTTGVLFFYSVLLKELLNALYATFYMTYVSSPELPLLEFSPSHMIMNLIQWATVYMEEADTFDYTCLFPYLWVLLGAAILLTAVSLGLYYARPTQAAGRSIAFRWAEPILKAMAVIPGSLYSGLFFRDISATEDFGWYLFGVIFGFLVLAIFIEIIFRRDIKCAFYHCRQLLIDGACVALLAAIFKMDALGYNTYVPSDAEIADCAVSIGGLMDTYADTLNSFYSADTYRMEHMHVADNPAIMTLARKAASEGLQYVEWTDADEEAQAVYEDQSDRYRRITFCYHLINEKSVYRQYYVDITDEETLQFLCEIYNDTDYLSNSVPLLSQGWEYRYESVRYAGQYVSGTIALDETQQARLLEAYQSEYMDLTLEEIMGSYPVATLEFLSNSSSHAYRCDSGYPVYASFAETIALLKEYGADVLATYRIENISPLKVTDYSKQLADGSYASVTYTDEEQIAQLLDACVLSQLTGSVYEYCALEDDISVVIGDGSYYDAQYFNVKKGALPNFASEDLKTVNK